MGKKMYVYYWYGQLMLPKLNIPGLSIITVSRMNSIVLSIVPLCWAAVEGKCQAVLKIPLDSEFHVTNKASECC